MSASLARRELLSYDEAKRRAIEGLRRALTHHERGEFLDLGDGYDELDYGLPRNAGPEFKKLLIALSFWDCWSDAGEHDWLFHEPLKQDDWPRLAKTVVKCLEDDVEITDPLLVDEFSPRPPAPSLRKRLRDLLGFTE